MYVILYIAKQHVPEAVWLMVLNITVITSLLFPLITTRTLMEPSHSETVYSAISSPTVVAADSTFTK